MTHHRPRKRFGQNFLQDKQVITHILNAMNIHEHDNLVEIGPGLGALTKPLLQQLHHLTAIEIDHDLPKHLMQLPDALKKLHLISADALTIDYSQWGPHLRVVGNLPYNVSVPLLLHLLTYSRFIEDMFFMLQKDVVLRLTASPGTKAYGRLSVMTQYQAEINCLFDVPPDAFYPIPKVNSAIVQIQPYLTSPYQPVDIKKLEPLVALAFSMKRKTIANNLKSILGRDALVTLGIDPTLRPEQLSIEDYVTITTSLL